MWSFAPKNGAKTPRTGQTNDYFGAGNIRSGLHRMKNRRTAVNGILASFI